jgi:hypothetical protein
VESDLISSSDNTSKALLHRIVGKMQTVSINKEMMKKTDEDTAAVMRGNRVTSPL